MVSSNYYVEDNSDLENRTLEAAKNHYQNGRFAEALKLYLSMLNTSISYKLYYEIGRCYYKLNDMLPAEEYFKKSIALENFKNPSYLYLGNIYYRRNDLKNAIENWISAYAYKPDDEAVCLNLATSYFSKGMKFQSVFYYKKYLKYAKNKNSSYVVIKNSIDKCNDIGNDFLQKAKQALSRRDNKSAIEYLVFAVKNMPVSFDINHLLGQVYMEENDFKQAVVYLKQALCLDNRSLDVLQKLTSVYINIGDYTSAYCVMRRLLPLVLRNQSEYLKTIKLINDLEDSFDESSLREVKFLAQKYDEENNYHMALMEYENCLMINEDAEVDIGERVERLKTFINPEERIIKTCMAKGEACYKNGDFKSSNKYFSKAMLMSHKDSPEYRLARGKYKELGL